MSRRTAGAAGVVAAGGGALVGWGLRRWVQVPEMPDPAGSHVVIADDGVPLHVEVDDGPEPTVVLVHGFTARLDEFQLQRESVQGHARVVLYDQRGHGQSGWGDASAATLDQLARDLEAVLDMHAPSGPIVLLGHSMGGMVIMALARLRPDLFGGRVRGVMLLTTSPGEVVAHGSLGRVVRTAERTRMLNTGLRLIQVAAPGLQKARKPGTQAGYRFTRNLLFGREDADPEAIRATQEMIDQSRFAVSAAFYPMFVNLDETGSFAALRTVPVTVVAGEDDNLTPLSHSEAMMDLLGDDAELIVVPGAGHIINVTRRDTVDEALLALVDRIRPPAP